MTAHPSGCGLSRSGFLPDRTVHLHPLDRCNLACSHCYSTSSPLKASILPVEPLIEALSLLRLEGYEVLSLSGGEPLLYPDLQRLVGAAKVLGYRVGVITNGFRITQRHRSLIESLDAIAVSFDGMEGLHNRIRGNARAWDVAIKALDYLREIGKPAAAAFTVSNQSLQDVPDFIELCATLGVRAVQLRPLVMAGRARSDATDLALSAEEEARLWMLGQTLALAYDGEVLVHTDLAPAEALSADRDAWSLALNGGPDQRLSDVVNPLLITPKGVLKPFTYDFPSEHDLGRLSDLVPDSRHKVRSRLPGLRSLVARTLHSVALQDGFIDWFAFQRDQALTEARRHRAALFSPHGHSPAVASQRL
ncbi:radical SAM protein [Tabrizicola sp.]|uniref:radical SAM protein n=1 Tax=Tabrizicola sp. TaxID=2005166 RepID=UPI00286B3C7F|nr:radical SAM protein [Tabrizicola sp.]